MKNKKVRIKHRVIKRVLGTKTKPRLSVYRSAKHLYAQLIDDTKGHTLVGISDLKLKDLKKTDAAYALGELLAKEAMKKKVKKVFFDRGRNRYHGRVRAVAEGARKGGLEF